MGDPHIRNGGIEVSYIFRNLHFIVVHVPIAMLLFSFIFDLIAAIWKRKNWHFAGLLCLVVGTFGVIAAVITGPEGERNPLLPTHESYGEITMTFFILLTLVRLWMLYRKKLDIGGNWIYLFAALIGVFLVSYTGHLGGKMVHPERHLQPGQFRQGDKYQSDKQRSNQGEIKSQNETKQ